MDWAERLGTEVVAGSTHEMPMPTALLLRTRILLVPILCLVLGGCGAGIFDSFSKGSPGGGSGVTPPPSFAITTSMLPSAAVGTMYVPTQIATAGARGPVSFAVVSGELPAGIQLSSSGILSGSAQEEGLFSFGVMADDGLSSDTRTLMLSVDVFMLAVDGLFCGDAWTGEPLTLTAVGQTSNVTFEIVANQSAGVLSSVDSALGRATYTPGTAVGTTHDTILATDTATGGTAEVTLSVVGHPVRNVVAEWGTSEVWFISFEALSGGHGYSRDFDAVLNRVGLRSVTGTDRTGGEYDMLASLLVRRATLLRVGQHFGRAADGSRGAGFPISFALEQPGAGYVAAVPGGWIAGAPNHYAVISIIDGSTPGVLGAAYLDGATNEVMENDTTGSGTGDLGVFANQLVASFNAAYQNNILQYDPVGPADVAALRAILYDRPFSGTRYEELKRITEGFGEALAVVVSHEIGHSLGLPHTSPFTEGSIMNASVAMYPGAQYGFIPADQGRLSMALPGPGRVGPVGKFAIVSTPGDAVTAAPEGGVQVCNLRISSPQCDCGCEGRDE